MTAYPTAEEFATAVKAYLDDGRSQRVMSDEFECAYSTVDRWARGVATPGKNVRRLVVEWIKST